MQLTNQKWKTIRPNATNNKKSRTPVTVHTEYQFQHTNRFAPLSSHNLGTQAEVDNTCKRERSRSAHPLANPTIQRCMRMRIPTIMNGRIISDNNMKPRKKSSDPQCNPNLKPKNFKVQIIGNSHLKVSATGINQYVNTEYEISSFSKPGACVDHLVHILDSELQCLGKKDAILINGGTNDLDKHNGNVNGTLVKMFQFILKYNNINILIVNLPHRHDLATTSMTNLRIQAYNTKLKHLTKMFNHVAIVEMSSDRNNYTKHGLHMNNIGKERFAKQIAYQIEKLSKLSNIAETKILLQWREERPMLVNVLTKTPTDKHEIGRLSTVSNSEALPPTVLTQKTSSTAITEPLLRVSSRNKRVPATMTQDFLW